MNIKATGKTAIVLLLAFLIPLILLIPAYADTDVIPPEGAVIGQYLIIGMMPDNDAVNINSGIELGAMRQTLSGGDPLDSFVSPLAPTLTPSDIRTTPNLRSVFFPDDSVPTDITKNRWIWDSTSQAHFLPFTEVDPDQNLFMARGADWSGEIAVTSATGTINLGGVNIFAKNGIRAANQSAPANVSSSNYFTDTITVGVSMDSLDDSLPVADSFLQGWDGDYDHSQLLTDLRSWRTFIRDLPRDTFFDDIDSQTDVEEWNTVAGNLPYNFDVDALDTNLDGFAVIDIKDDGTDFEVNNSDWVIEDSNTANGTPFIIFRIRGAANMNISNSSIIAGDGLTCRNGAAALFVKAFPEEEFTSTSGSSDTVFNANNMIFDQVVFWDLNTIGDARDDTDYGAPSDDSVYDGVDMPIDDNVDRGVQENYTTYNFSNGQGCTQMVSGQVSLSNIRFTRCTRCDGPQGGPLPIELVGINAGASGDPMGTTLVLIASALFFTLLWLLTSRRISVTNK